MAIPGLALRYRLRGSFFFGFFQFAMPVLGWLLGRSFARFTGGFAGWIAFALLAFIGGRMIWEAVRQKKEPQAAPDAHASDVRSLGWLFMLAIATSIDALAVGVSFSMLKENAWGPSIIIGIVTFLVSFVGFELGRRIGALFKHYAQIAGGLCLIGIGIKMLFS
jgi:putative Mn2+ efflux pump MntP